MDNDSIKENILRLRKLRGLTQTEVARRCGISMTHYRSLESGTASLINPIMSQIAKALDIGTVCLIFGSWNRADKDFRLEEEAADYGPGGSANDRSESRFRELRDEYETRLSTIRDENNVLRQVVETQKRDISHLESIVRMLRRLKGVEEF